MKISVVMQTFLGNYPGSRSNPEKKFIRAVNSFLDQTYENKELIIVADGCSIAPEIFYSNWASDSRIKFVYIHKNGANMYEKVNNITFYRGIPKKIGCAAADGDIITYMDSDDIILPTRLEHLHNAWKDQPQDVMWSTNPLRWWAYYFEPANEIVTRVEDSILDLSTYGIDKKFALISLPPDYSLKSTWALAHRKNILASWRDTQNPTSEDCDFYYQLDHKYKYKGFRQESPTYVVCHYREEWDY